MSHWPPVSFAGKNLMFTVGVSFLSVLGLLGFSYYSMHPSHC